MTSAVLPASPWRRWLPAVVLAGLAAAAVWTATGGLAVEARVTLVVFALAVVAWTLTPLDDLAVAAAAVAVLLLAGATRAQDLPALARHELIWLLISAYVMAAAIRRTTLAERLAVAFAQGSRSLAQLFYRLTGFIALTAFVVPTTSGRAALLLPVFLVFSEALRQPQATKALSLLFPSVILLSACGALTGAGAHLIALDLVEAASGETQRIGYLAWTVLMLPIALLTSFAATFAILRLFLPRTVRERRPDLPARTPVPLTSGEVAMLATVAAAVLLWSTQAVHGLGLATIGLAAAAVLAVLSGVAAPRALAGAVEWKLLAFLAATMLLGEALVTTGAGAGVAEALLAAMPAGALAEPWRVATAVAGVALVSHTFILSRSARAAVLVPMLAVPLAASGYAPAATALLIVAGTGFCQSTRVSAKPIMIYGGTSGPVFSSRDLLRLSAALLPVAWIVLVVSATVVWPVLGLPFQNP